MIVVRRIVWDDWNIEHIARHNVRPIEVEQVCAGDPLVLQSYQGRLLLIGATTTRRMLAVVLAPESADAYYPVTARPASRKERQLFQEFREQADQEGSTDDG